MESRTKISGLTIVGVILLALFIFTALNKMGENPYTGEEIQDQDSASQIVDSLFAPVAFTAIIQDQKKVICGGAKVI